MKHSTIAFAAIAAVIVGSAAYLFSAKHFSPSPNPITEYENSVQEQAEMAEMDAKVERWYAQQEANLRRICPNEYSRAIVAVEDYAHNDPDFNTPEMKKNLLRIIVTHKNLCGANPTTPVDDM
jgi:hypothetical protein